MSKIDRKHFFDNYPYKALTDTQISNINILMDEFDNDDNMTYLTWFGYILGTIYHECAATWKPIAEYGKGKGRTYGSPDPVTGKTYYGRGWVQLTWKANYQKLGNLLSIDLVNSPELALNVAPATKICFIGMREGLFTGKKLSNYFNDTSTDWVNARRIINGTDCANLIGGYGQKFYNILQFVDEDKQVLPPEVNPDETTAQAEAQNPVVETDPETGEIAHKATPIN